MGYIDFDYKPKEDLLTLFYVEPEEGVSIEKAAENIAAESSVGTWTDVMTISPERREKIQARVYRIEGNYIWIAYPSLLFEPSNIPQILSSIAGNIYGMKMIKNLRLVDVYFPDIFINSNSGPSFGIEGVREITGVRDRPLIGTIVKPKLGLTAKEHAEVLYESFVGGCDIVKDDENLTSQDFNPFKERIELSLEARRKAEEETGEVKIYMPNITAPYEVMVERAEFVKEKGGRYIMIDVITAGFSAVQAIRKLNLNLVIHAHRAMHGALTRNKKHGITMLVLAKFLRLAGVDQLHIGTVVGKMEGEKEEVLRIHESIERDKIEGDGFYFSQSWGDIKPVFSVASGGLHPGHIPALIKLFGKDLIIQAGGGIHGHPDGTISGARAMRESLDIVLKGGDIRRDASPNLKKVIDMWGVVDV